jgi:integrase
MGPGGSKMGGKPRAGVERRDKSLRITFTWQGVARKETVKIDGKPVEPTPRGEAYARKLAAEIQEKLDRQTFVYVDYFPASPHATTGAGTTVGDQLDLWLGLQTDKESSTLKGYRVGVSFWKLHIGSKGLRALVHSDVLAALAAQPTWTGKTRNNKVSVLRQALALAIRDKKLTSSPLEGLDAAKHQRPEPDPFSRDEAEAIVADMHARYPAQVALYFEAKFFTGMRTSESLGMRWDSIDWAKSQMAVREAIVLGEHKTRTKTHRIRTLELNSRALAALKSQKAHTFMKPAGWVFMDPVSGERWVDDWNPREKYWRPCLKRLGIRYRSPYETRHTFATMMLMAGMTPAYCARQLGHSVEQFLRTYSKWLDGGQNAVEQAKLERHLSGENPRESAA